MTEYVKKADVFALMNASRNMQEMREGFSRIMTSVFGAREEKMHIKTFGEMEQRVWERIRRPCVAVYEMTEGPVRYLVKVYDGDLYTGIYLQAGDLDWIREDIARNASWLERVDRGAEDVPELVCVFV